MTQKESIALFIDCYKYESENVLKARLKDSSLSRTTVRCEYLDFIDYLAKDKQITERQRNNWCAPSWMY